MIAQAFVTFLFLLLFALLALLAVLSIVCAYFEIRDWCQRRKPRRRIVVTDSRGVVGHA